MDFPNDYHKMSQDFLETSIEFENLFEKSANVSTEARKSGNQLYTQKKHDQTIHKNILLLYSKSIAFAPNDSEELALGYSNRSALLMHLHQYKYCLVDVNRALQITQSVKLKCKLQARKQKCLVLMKNRNAEKNSEESIKDQISGDNTKLVASKNGKVLELPSFTPSTFMQSASEAITVKYDNKFGRHLVATRYIKPGEVIIAERGYTCYPIIKHRHLICSHCLSFPWNGIPCKSCAFAVYCSESCREDAWKQYHDVECNLFQYISCMFYDDESFVPDIVFAIRLFIVAVKKEGIDTVIKETQAHNSNLKGLMVDGKLRSDMFKSCINLHSHLQHDEDEYNFNISIAAHALFFECNNLFESKENKDNVASHTYCVNQVKSILKKLIGVIDVNSFKYQATTCMCKSFEKCKGECESIRGVILAPVCSLINHSCNSNVNRIFLPNGKVVMFTVAPVKEGEQLFESYGPSLHVEKEERQRHLKKGFNFTCECRPCRDNWPTDLHLLVQVDERELELTSYQIMQEFKETFPYVSDISILDNDEDRWQYDEETLTYIIKLSELTYKYFDDYVLATIYNLQYRFYIDKAFFTLYGERCVLPDKC